MHKRMTQRYMTRLEVAAYTGLSLSTINRWLRAGLPRIKTPSGGILIDRERLDAFLAAREEVVTP